MIKAKKKKHKTKKKHKKRDGIAKVLKPPRNSKGQLISGWGKGSKQIKKKEAKKKAKKKTVKVLRAADGKLLPGTPSLNPAGGPVGTTHLDEFKVAMREVEKTKRKTLMKHFCERAFKSDRVLCIWVDRVLPSLKAIQVQEVPGDGMSEEEKEEIRKEHKKRFEGLYGNSDAHK